MRVFILLPSNCNIAVRMTRQRSMFILHNKNVFFPLNHHAAGTNIATLCTFFSKEHVTKIYRDPEPYIPMGYHTKQHGNYFIRSGVGIIRCPQMGLIGKGSSSFMISLKKSASFCRSLGKFFLLVGNIALLICLCFSPRFVQGK